MECSAILAVDLGSTRLKAAWIRPDGRPGPVTRVESPLRNPDRQPGTIWDSVTAVMAGLLQSPEAPGSILAVALTGVTRSHVFLDGAGNVSGPLLLWDDPYGEERATEVAAACGMPGDTPGYGAFHPLARLTQFARDTGTVPAAMVELKDWLNFRLTGRLATDSIAYGRLQQGAAAAAAQALARLGFPASAIPAPLAPDTCLGRIQALEDPALRRLAGVPVATSSFDTWCSTLGMGAITAGAIYDISGTTQVMGTFTEAPGALPGMVCMPWTPTLWHIGGPCQTGLGTLAWFARTFLDTEDPAAVLDAACASGTQDPPLCIPYLAGERMPWWNSGLSASFHGVRAHHTRGDFARAVVEGLAMAHRIALDQAGIRRPGARVHMGGGGSALSLWRQTRADAFGLPVSVGASPESALVGAALAAGVAVGYHHDLPASQAAVSQDHVLIHPDPDRTRYFDARVAAFSALLDQTLAAT